ncbi:MAG: hypothetical protein KatS3mg110_0922 [Pirellulaceae bacterium]|nr:MAG: hypothetical protein KatS3mg110_0922 [Pirellulaceae bacterium]
MEIGLGVIGGGNFGLYAVQQFLQVDGVRLVALAATHREAALAFARRFGIERVLELEQLLDHPQVDMVYIATPPFLHYPQALAALEAGKHVFCEKPLALNVAQADRLISEAHKRNLLVAANLLQRYNPVADAIQELIRRRVLGELLHGYFENYAADEGLPAEHWFWDRAKSGGIFVEHGVHFFDLLAYWLGSGTVVAAQRSLRPPLGLEEQVQCTVRYSGSVLFNFYHGFHQVGKMDRQELRLVFELGEVTLFEWIPTRARVYALLDEARTRQLVELFPRARLDVLQVYSAKDRVCTGRHRAVDGFQLIELHAGDGVTKGQRYCELLRAIFADQVAWVRDRSHRRRLTEQESRDALAMACEADRLACQSAGG